MESHLGHIDTVQKHSTASNVNQFIERQEHGALAGGCAAHCPTGGTGRHGEGDSLQYWGQSRRIPCLQIVQQDL